jgi:hypothetical protein
MGVEAALRERGELDAGLPDHDPAPPSPRHGWQRSSSHPIHGMPKGISFDQRGIAFTTIVRIGIRPGDRQVPFSRCDTSWSVTIIFFGVLAGDAA